MASSDAKNSSTHTPASKSFAKDFLRLTPEEMEDAILALEQSEKVESELKAMTSAHADLFQVHGEIHEKLSSFENERAVLNEQLALLKAQIGSGSIMAAARPVTEDGFEGAIPVLDTQYTPPKWARDILDHLMADESLPVVGLAGPAGIGKTHGIEQWAALHKRRVVLLNCKGQDPFAFVESQELEDGKTVRKLGVLAKAIQSPHTIIVLDEIDTAPNEFQSLLLGMLEVEPFRRRLTTQGNGMLTVADGVRFVLTMNNIGMNCSSRHRGAVLPPIQNRISGCAGWVAVPMPEEKDLAKLFITKNPTMNVQYVTAVAKAVLGLIKLAADGAVDADVSIRTGLGVCKSIHRFGVRCAWNLALLDGIDDPTQKASAITAISTHFPADFRPVG